MTDMTTVVIIKSYLKPIFSRSSLLKSAIASFHSATDVQTSSFGPVPISAQHNELSPAPFALADIPDRKSQLDFFSQCWKNSSVETISQGGCIEVRPFPPDAQCLNFPVSQLPLLPTTRQSLIQNFGITHLTPTQWRFMGPLLGSRDVLLLSRPKEGKTTIAITALIELVTQRVLELEETDRALRTRRDNSRPSESTGEKLEEKGLVKTTPADSSEFRPPPRRRLMAVVVGPTWDSVYSTSQDCSRLLRDHPLGLRIGTACGGDDIDREIRKLSTADHPHILFGTLGRLTDHLWNTSGFASKLRKADFLVIDDAFNVLSNPIQVDQIRSIRKTMSQTHQSILLATTMDESLRRLAFRSLRTNFAVVNCVENGNAQHRFDFREWVSGADGVGEIGGEKKDVKTREPSSSIEPYIRILHPFLFRVKNDSPNPALLAGLLTERLRQNNRSVDRLAEDSIADSFSSEKNSERIWETDHRKISESDDESAVMTNNCPNASVDSAKFRDVWITRTSEKALRSAACPTSSSVTIYSLIYDPLEFVGTLFNLIRLELTGEAEDLLESTGRVLDIDNFKDFKDDEISQLKEMKERKVVVVFSTVRTVEFYSILFRDFLQVHLASLSTSFISFSSLSEYRSSAIRQFRRLRSAVMFCSSLAHAASIDAHCVIHVGIGHNPEDAVKQCGIPTL